MKAGRRGARTRSLRRLPDADPYESQRGLGWRSAIHVAKRARSRNPTVRPPSALSEATIAETEAAHRPARGAVCGAGVSATSTPAIPRASPGRCASPFTVNRHACCTARSPWREKVRIGERTPGSSFRKHARRSFLPFTTPPTGKNPRATWPRTGRRGGCGGVSGARFSKETAPGFPPAPAHRVSRRDASAPPPVRNRSEQVVFHDLGPGRREIRHEFPPARTSWRRTSA